MDNETMIGGYNWTTTGAEGMGEGGIRTTTPWNMFDYISYGYWDYLLIKWKIRAGSLTVMSFTGLLTLVLNTYIVCLFLFARQFRKLEYYPLALNSFVDIFGSGLIPPITEFMFATYEFNYERGRDAFTGYFFRYFGERYQNNYRVANCLAYFLRYLSAQYATGPCVLVLALDRYLAVCWPHQVKQILTRRVRVAICTTITLIILFIAIASSAIVSKNLLDGGSTCTTMIWGDLLTRNNMDGLLFYLLPASISCVLYCITGYRLTQMRGSQRVRNRQLTIALILSTVFWMVCWAPQTAVAFYDNTIMDNFNFEYYNQTMFYYIMQEMMALSFLSHAYVSPLLILFISRKFQEPFRRWWQISIIAKLKGVEKVYQGPTASSTANSVGTGGTRRGGLSVNPSSNNQLTNNSSTAAEKEEQPKKHQLK
ncbi:uncharacterized protein LOC134848439 isoform X2 [Symsagittifera roscoffensis]|uniref:uncharacterized protein LOC134848439 isoform X2 n=1 Tax=Symsagittifera roscoffensis TaxID=84072 RepID=UPI00307B4314